MHLTKVQYNTTDRRAPQSMVNEHLEFVFLLFSVSFYQLKKNKIHYLSILQI